MIPMLDRQRHFPRDLLASQLNTTGESHVPEGDIILKERLGAREREISHGMLDKKS